MVAGSAEHSINFCYGVSPSLQKPSAIFLALGSSASSFFFMWVGLNSTPEFRDWVLGAFRCFGKLFPFNSVPRIDSST